MVNIKKLKIFDVINTKSKYLLLKQRINVKYSICGSQNMKGTFWQIQLLSLNARHSLKLLKYIFAKRYLS